MRRLRIVPIFLSLAVFCTIASACALTDALSYGRPKFQAEISYTPPPQNESTRLVGVENVRVVVSDERPSKAVIQEPYFGHPGDEVSFAPIMPDRPVTATLQSAIEYELVARGFSLGNDGKSVDLTLSKFEARYGTGFSGPESGALADLVMNVVIRRCDSSSAYTRQIDAHERSRAILDLKGPGNEESALNLALQRAVSDLFSDSAFLAALSAEGLKKSTQSAGGTRALVSIRSSCRGGDHQRTPTSAR